MRVDSTRVWEEFIAPYGVQNHIAIQRPIGIMQEEAKQIVFGGRELQFVAFACDDAPFKIDLFVSEMRPLARVGGGPAQNRADAGYQLAGPERLHHVIVSAN